MHTRKKQGERKDKKNARMREAEAAKDQEREEHNSDQVDVVDFKSGGLSDRNQTPSAKHSRRGL